MAATREQVREELRTLVKEGRELQAHEQMRHLSDERLVEWQAELARRKKSAGKQGEKPLSKAQIAKLRRELKPLRSHYQSWYSRALRVVEHLLPDRYDEFRELYQPTRRKELNWTTYAVSDLLHGTVVRRGYGVDAGEEVFDAQRAGLNRFQQQVDILASAEARLDSLLSDIRGVIEADLFDDELSAARELLAAQHLRSGGVVAGVVLERHLKRLIANHQVTFRKKATLANLNDALKAAGVYDVTQWRQLQRLADIRNLCAHDAGREPTRDEVHDLIEGTAKVVATLF